MLKASLNVICTAGKSLGLSTDQIIKTVKRNEVIDLFAEFQTSIITALIQEVKNVQTRKDSCDSTQ